MILCGMAIAQTDAPRAARSVHLWYNAPDAVAFYNEVTVQESQRGSYFCVCGFNHGYFGIQELIEPGKKVAIFSVWDPGKQNNPNAVAEDDRVKVIASGEGVRIKRFGGEGTGGQSMIDFDWKIGQTIRCLVRGQVEGKHTTYSAFISLPDKNEWKHMASFQTLTGGELLKGYYSFVEDFRRNGESAKQSRRATYGNGWVQTADGKWLPLTEATFTGDNTPTMNIDAGAENNRFFLQTGGDTMNKTALRSKMTVSADGLSLPKDLPDVPSKASSVPQQIERGGQIWKLVWNDEFTTDGRPDPAKWGYEQGFVRNNEKQFYTKDRPENARVEKGNLVIESRKEPFDKGEYTSASLITRGKAEWVCGRIEVRAKIPTGRGTWPAIWMLGANRALGWPACGEIDIMENVGYDPDVICANIHTKAYNHVKKTNKGNRITAKAPYNDFHIYAIDWYPDHIDFFFDDQKYFSFANEGTGNDVWPYDKPHYLILNTALGGSWGGQKGIDDSIFPQKFLIDYVRVYQKVD
jgi:beta-glucanase (GH16 family)